MAKPNNFVIEDTNFLVSIISQNDPFHDKAVELLMTLSKMDLVYVYPEIVIKEAIFTLMKAGFADTYVRGRISKLSMIPQVIIQENDILTTLRYISRKYSGLFYDGGYGKKQLTKTNDYVIACNAIDYKATVITGDAQLLSCLNNQDINCIDYTKDNAIDVLDSLFGV